MNSAQLTAEMNAKMEAARGLKKIDLVQNEGGEGYSQHEATCEAIFAEYSPRIAAAKAAEFAAEWTAEVFAARRAEWNAQNALCKSHADVAKMVAKLGYSLADLKQAKQLLGA